MSSGIYGKVVVLLVLVSVLAACRFAIRTRERELPPEHETPIGSIEHSDYVRVNDIVFHFDRRYPIGRFANGDFWVVGPVRIVEIEPAYRNGHHGWEINPCPGTVHGFDKRVSGFDPALIPALPLSAEGGSSIVKAISRVPLDEPGLRPSLQQAAVLTVVDTPPPGNGATVFRPPYTGDFKPLYHTDAIRRELLPEYEAVQPMPSLERVYLNFRNLQMDHIGGGASQYFRPADSLPFYAADIAARTADAPLRLMLGPRSDPDYDRALYAYLQCGLDYYHFVKQGYLWPRGGGEQPGHKLPIVFFVTLLGDSQMQQRIGQTMLYEDFMTCYGVEDVPLWGQFGEASLNKSDYRGYEEGRWESSYWNNIANGSGSRTFGDPYGLIDGGQEPGGWYQFCCSTQPFKGTALALNLMPALRDVWNPESLLAYADRWVHFGIWTRPDPFAAPGEPEQRGSSWGSIEGQPGQAVRDGRGRFPELHGLGRDSGFRATAFQGAMWNAYRAHAPGADAVGPFAAIIEPLSGAVVSGPLQLMASAYGIHGVSGLQWYLNEERLGDMQLEPLHDADETVDGIPPRTWGYLLDTEGLGSIRLEVEVVDGLGQRFRSRAVEVTKSPP